MKQYLVVFFIPFIFSCQTINHNLKPKETYSWTRQADQYAQDGLLREAITAYNKALKHNPKNLIARRNLGIILVKAASYKAAIRNLEKVIGKFDKDFDTNYYLGEAYRALEKYAEAIYRYKKALTIKTNEPRVMKALAWSYFKIRYYRQSLKLAHSYYKTNPNDGQIAIILGRILLKLKKYKLALHTIKKAKTISPKASKPYFNSVEGDIYLAQNNCTKAINSYRAALKVQPLLAGSLLGLGHCFLLDGQTNKAITYLKRSLRIRPSLVEGYYLLGKAYENKNSRKAYKFYKRFSKYADKDPAFINKVLEAKQSMKALASTPKSSNKTKNL